MEDKAQIIFQALVKKVSAKALVSLDKEFEIILRTQDVVAGQLVTAPADQMVEIIVKYV